MLKIPYELRVNGKLSPWIFLHEFGHAFAKLIDEYPFGGSYESSPGLGTDNFITSSNCTTWTPLYYFNNQSWGGYSGSPPNFFRGCTFGTTSKGRIIYRPSSNSIMNYVRLDGLNGWFNVVSCGHILKAINDSPSAKQHFPECAASHSIIPVGQ